MGNFWWWTALTGAHAILFAVLWRYRREDHPWLLVFFGVQWLADCVGFLIYPTKAGGLNALGAVLGTSGGKLAVYYLASVGWFTFWFLSALTAERLALGRLRRFWLPTLIVFAVLWAFVINGYLSRDVSRKLYLGLIHWVIDPFLLLYTLYYLVRYLARCLRNALEIDLLTLALMLVCTNFTLKLLFAIQPNLGFDRSFSVLYYTVCLVTFFSYYATVKVRAHRNAEAAPQPAPAE